MLNIISKGSGPSKGKNLHDPQKEIEVTMASGYCGKRHHQGSVQHMNKHVICVANPFMSEEYAYQREVARLGRQPCQVQWQIHKTHKKAILRACPNTSQMDKTQFELSIL